MTPYPIPPHLKGLSPSELELSRTQHGYNQGAKIPKTNWYQMLLVIGKEPMLVLLIAVAIIYLLVGEMQEAVFMLAAIIAVSGISFYQDNRSKKALEALKKWNEPLAMVIRQSKQISIPTREIAVGDLCIIEEGKMIPADGQIIYSHDFSVNESSLTGESVPVYKHVKSEDNMAYSGTLVTSGLAVMEVAHIGDQTMVGEIGRSLEDIEDISSPLQVQIRAFVRWMALVGLAVFLMVWIYSYLESGDLLESLLVGLTLAMSILPEEIPVAFTTFMALGAWKLMREGVIIKRSSLVETLGSTTVICTDKTGTITENVMELKALYDYKTQKLYEPLRFSDPNIQELLSYAMWSSEPIPFNPMEISLHQAYGNFVDQDLRGSFHMIHEYPLDGNPPMMTHVFENSSSKRVIAAKGSPEAILESSCLSKEEKAKLREELERLGRQGFRVLGVAKAGYEGHDFPEKQQDFDFEFLGFTVFYDPPKKGIQDVFKKIYDAGIQVKLITGDYAHTSYAIAEQAGIRNQGPAVNGSEILSLSPHELIALSKKTSLFTRMFPLSKLAMVNALKQDGEVVAMLGDGINDAPALKAAHIGVAMGKKGTEMAKAAAALIITHDDLDKLIVAIAAGRRIHANLKKAIQYIISIHIPIVLIVSLPLFLGWVYPHIFTPVHVIFLELIMGPICSIVYENEPMEKDTMQQKPRKVTETFLNRKELSISLVQGGLITLGLIFVYQYSVLNGGSESTTRAMVFTSLVIANLWLSLVNRSFVYSISDSLLAKNKWFPMVITATLLMLMAILYIPSLAEFFQVTALGPKEIILSFLSASLSVLWFEVYKWNKRRKRVQEVQE